MSVKLSGTIGRNKRGNFEMELTLANGKQTVAIADTRLSRRKAIESVMQSLQEQLDEWGLK